MYSCFIIEDTRATINSKEQKKWELKLIKNKVQENGIYKGTLWVNPVSNFDFICSVLTVQFRLLCSATAV